METWGQTIQLTAARQQINATQILVNAKRLMVNEFQFNRQYDMEPTPRVYQMNPITWQTSPNGDPEWLYMLKRQEYLYDLLDAYYLTANTDYLLKCRELMLAWIDHNLADDTTWRTIDTGIRLLNWTGVVAALKRAKLLNDATITRLKHAVEQQADYLKSHYLEKYQTSNWGVLITTGILVWNVYFPGVIKTTTFDWARRTYVTELELQVADDGSNWEQSPLYFIEVWRSSLAVLAAYHARHVSVPTILLRKVRALHAYAPYMIRPNGQTIMQGDSDQMRIDELYALSAALCDKAWPTATIFRFKLDPVILELWHQLPTMTFKPAPISSSTYVSAASGNVFYRSSWRTAADYWHVYNGNLGSGHGHAALGHVDLALSGHDILVDSGRYTYVDSPERRWLKSTAAHNVIVLDGRPFSVPKDSWKYQTVATPLGNQHFEDDQYAVVSMTYNDANRPVPLTVNRWGLWDKTYRTMVILDGLLTKGRHHVQRYWHLATGLTEQPVSDQLLRLKTGAQTNGQVYFTDAVQTVTNELYSPVYNQRETSRCVTTAATFDDQTVIATVITSDPNAKLTRTPLTQSGDGTPTVDAGHALGVTVKFGDQTKRTYVRQLLNTFIGNKMYYADGQPFYGNLCVMTKQAQNRDYQRIW
ncbi:oligohyaluronate lyase [Lactiplantibacillus garii]|uniref:Oligohyaluronate lyase n=1 Tax=Lactiplantibacillus garii TaxID=2306423 RepID=A0A426D4H7_9LACO|nr:alginate lyase family protein [Lactiplantibacillus garii]RRK09464.1 oligohyaluronate lyase [Lactiplantibacillus garii]